MALARLITRTPELAQTLAASLTQAGYEVEFASPEMIPAGRVDLEVNLDDPAAATSYIVTSDGTEISFTYDPVEREFVLAPLWRRARQPFLPAKTALTRLLRPLRAAAEPTATHVDIVAPSVPAAPIPQLADLRPEPESSPSPQLVSPLLPEPASHSLYLAAATPLSIEADTEPAPIHFSGVDLFDGHGVRRTPNHIDIAPAAGPAPLPDTEETATQESAVEAAALPPSRIWHSWKTRSYTLAAGARTFALSRWQRLKAYRGGEAMSEYDLAWLRAVPVAALIALAFLLGWSLSGSGSPPPATAPVELNEAAVIPVQTAAPAPTLKATSTKPSPKKAAVPTTDAVSEADFTAEDVVVRHYPKHYPAKDVRADNQRPSVRRYSDIE